MRKMNEDKLVLVEGMFSLAKATLTALELAQQRQLDARENLLRVAVDGAEKVNPENFGALLGAIEQIGRAHV